MKKFFIILPFLIVLIISQAIFASEVETIDHNLFPVSSRLQTQVDFWKIIYTKVYDHEAVIHDKDDLSIIYKTIDLKGLSRRHAQKFSEREKGKIKKILYSIYQKKKKGLVLNFQEEKLDELLEQPDLQILKKRMKNLRSQRGQRNAFHASLVRSYRYIDLIHEKIKEAGLPTILRFLPHVESSFNYKAYSKVGAAGIWQFTRATGKRFLKVNYAIDERRDVIESTKAAIKLLQSNYRRLETWPLAITAYNHGPNRLVKMKKKLGLTDLETIMEHYQDRRGHRFGFASRNFYASFIAAVTIALNPHKYFKDIEEDQPVKFSKIKLQKRLLLKDIYKKLGISKKILLEYNPAFKRPVVNSSFPLPKNYILKIPKVNQETLNEYQEQLLSLKDISRKFTNNRYIVDRGDSLYTIARTYKVSLHELIEINNIRNPRRIRPGKSLILPFSRYSNHQKRRRYRSSKKQRQARYTYLKNTELLKMADIDPDSIILDGYKFAMKILPSNLYIITVEVKENIGEFAEWLQIRANQIRHWNRLRYNQYIRVGQRLKLYIPSKKFEHFIKKRFEYHIAIQEEFFKKYLVTETQNYKIKRGDTLYEISKKHDIPRWLLRKYQPNKNITLHYGKTLIVPQIEAKQSDD